MVILSDEATSLANTLGKAEATFELAMTATDAAINAAQGMFAGVVINYGVPIAIAAYAIALGYKTSEALRKSWEHEEKRAIFFLRAVPILHILSVLFCRKMYSVSRTESRNHGF